MACASNHLNHETGELGEPTFHLGEKRKLFLHLRTFVQWGSNSENVDVQSLHSSVEMSLCTVLNMTSKSGKANLVAHSFSAPTTGSKHTKGKKEEDLKGLRVKVTHTFAANGASAPVFVSVCGSNERELSIVDCSSGVLILDVAGLCVGGAGVNVGSSNEGCMIFACNDQDRQTEVQSTL